MTWFGKAGTFGLMVAFPLFLASQSTLGWRDTGGWLAWCAAIPGIVLSYIAAGLYVPLGLRALRDGRADRAATASGTARFVSAQNQYNLLDRSAEDALLPAAGRLGLGFLPYFPLANGLFTGKFTRTERPADTRIARQRPQVADDAPWDAMEAHAAFCATRGISMLEATFGWFLSHPELSSVIAGATRPEQIAANAVAADRWRPSSEERAEIERLFPR